MTNLRYRLAQMLFRYAFRFLPASPYKDGLGEVWVMYNDQVMTAVRKKRLEGIAGEAKG